MAEAAGARLTDASAFYGHLLSRNSMTKPGLWPYPTMDTLVGGAVMVDRSGRRFIDEGLGGIAHSNALARSPDPLCATAVFDQAIWDTAGKAELVPPNPDARECRRHADQRARPRDAGGQNRCAGGGAGRHDRGLQRAVTAEPGRALDAAAHGRAHVRRVPQLRQTRDPLPVAQPPFYAIPLVGRHLLHHGRHRDRRAGARDRARRRADRRALAAGSCTGGVEGGPLGGYIGGYLKAVGLALIAADTIAATRSRRRPDMTLLAHQ